MEFAFRILVVLNVNVRDLKAEFFQLHTSDLKVRHKIADMIIEYFVAFR